VRPHDVRPLGGGNPAESLASRVRFTAPLNTTSLFSITMRRAQLSSGSRHTTLESNNRVNHSAS
jgi:hypothetical protein